MLVGVGDFCSNLQSSSIVNYVINMGNLGDTVNYILFYNPISTEVGKLLKNTGILKPKANGTSTQTVVVMQRQLWQLAQDGGPWVRLGGLLGASAVVLGAYGAHRTYPEDQKADLRRIYETANRFHFIHSLALLAVPMARRPMLSGSLLTLGTVLFCGACYYHAFTGDRTPQRLAPIGGTCLILGWLAIVL